MMTILLYGHLGKRFGKVHHYDVASAAEAVRALSVTLNGFRQAVAQAGWYKVLTGGSDALTAERLAEPASQKKTIRIVPVIQGAGSVGKIILGAVLIAASFLPGFQFLGKIGVSMVLSGVSQLLFSPKPTQVGANERPENRPSYAFDGAVNTAAQGNPVPILYGGPLIVGSQVVSAGLSVEQIA